MFRDIPIIRFGVTDGRKADVFINDRPAGAIQFYQGTTWTYDHHGLSLVGTQLESGRPSCATISQRGFNEMSAGRRDYCLRRRRATTSPGP